MIRYVCGFLFNRERTRVALIRKAQPKWQAGKLNGIGGKIEFGESELQAMAREFKEETGVFIYPWQEFAILAGRDGQVHFFCAFNDAVEDVATVESKGEVVGVHRVQSLSLRPDLVGNLRVLIPLALDDTGIGRPVILEDTRSAA